MAQNVEIFPNQFFSLTRVYLFILSIIYKIGFTLLIGRTGQRLDEWFKQHVPTKIRLGNYFADHINNTYGSAIAEHLINNREYASTYIADLFTILSRSHSDIHLKVLETPYILIH